jgi:hypothetical protein
MDILQGEGIVKFMKFVQECVVNAMPQLLCPPRNNPVAHCKEAGELWGKSGQVQRILPLPGFEPQIIQLVMSCYTDLVFQLPENMAES